MTECCVIAEWLLRSRRVVMTGAMVRSCVAPVAVTMGFVMVTRMRGCISGLRGAGEERQRDHRQNDPQDVFHGQSPKT